MSKKMISLEISDELREALRIKAFNEHLSISKLIRNILEEKFATELTDSNTEITKETEMM